ncbi:MAG: AAA family ATPase [Myxococcota bacterium]|nr:AAA family ATPase [Myxococcota bacterium]
MAKKAARGLPLRSVQVAAADPDSRAAFPFCVPALQSLGTLRFRSAVTFLVGENGSGKSTFLEALAIASRRIAVGSVPLDRDETLDPVRPLARAMRLEWSRQTPRGFFLRAEDFFGFVKQVREEVARFEAEAARVRRESPDLEPGELTRILTPYTGSSGALRARYGDDADAGSHGEQFLAFFHSRLVPGGLYLLDEPEVPFSPARQLALLHLLRQYAVAEGCQFVIATHSPMLLALPDAEIWSFDEPPLRAVAWEDLEHVRLMRDFLNRPEAYLRHLDDPEDPS